MIKQKDFKKYFDLFLGDLINFDKDLISRSWVDWFNIEFNGDEKELENHIVSLVRAFRHNRKTTSVLYCLGEVYEVAMGMVILMANYDQFRDTTTREELNGGN